MLRTPTFRYDLPTSVEFGNGSVRLIADRVKQFGGTRVLIVSDPGVVKAGIVERVVEPLVDASLPFIQYADVESDPAIESVEKGIRVAKEGQCDLVIGVGGGSALDTAKAVGLMLGNDGSVRDYIGINKVPHRGAPVIAIPTSAGTGSEITIWSVLTDRQANAKVSVGSVHNCPSLAICDPELTVTLPAHITAATGLDALTHAVESYVNKATQPISEALARRAIELISSNLRLAVVQGDNLEARYGMLLGSLMAAMAFNPTRLGLSHALAMPLGAQFHIPHGVVNAILLPEVMQFNIIGNVQKYADIAVIMSGMSVPADKTLRELAEDSVGAVRLLRSDVRLRETLSDYGVQETDLPSVAAEAMLSGNVPVNPRTSTIADLVDICLAAMGNS